MEVPSIVPHTCYLPMSELFADDEFNCRGKITPIEVADLARDIEAKGLIQPITVAPLQEGDTGYPEYKYKIIAGHRRHLAHRVLKADTIFSLVREDMRDPIRARAFNLTENLQRTDLNILQEARAIEKLHQAGLGRSSISKETGMSDGWVQTRIYLLKLPDVVQTEVVACKMATQDIRDLYSVYNRSGAEACFAAVKAIKTHKAAGARKPDINKVQKAPANRKRKRDYADLVDLMGVIQDTLGNSLTTRVISWAAGIIDDREIYADIKEACDAAGIDYEIPVLRD